MKTLYLIRHAEALSPLASQRDADRHLSSHGYTQALEMSGLINRQGLSLQCIITSPAERTFATATILSRNMPEKPAVMVMDELYLAESETLIDCITRIPDSFSVAGLCGHNPGISDLISSLISENHHYAMAPCAVAILTFDNDSWGMASGGLFTLADYKEPSC